VAGVTTRESNNVRTCFNRINREQVGVLRQLLNVAFQCYLGGHAVA